MSELPFLGLRPGMFSGAAHCPGCGFATSDPNLYECPNCQRVWRERPQQRGLVCVTCDQALVAGQPVNLTDAGVEHQECPETAARLQNDGLPEAPEGYLSIVQAAPANPTPGPRKRKRKRKRKKPAQRPAVQVNESDPQQPDQVPNVP